MQCRKMPNSKAPGKDDVQGYWLKNLTSFHPRITVQLNHVLDGERPLPLEIQYCDKKTLQRSVQLITIDQYPGSP